ncbi:MAG TPA: hypothetical protein VM432_12855 [Bdellovibrionales bacterium]|nr:hypothetical protein [Bdellovibrionales bacterium]
MKRARFFITFAAAFLVASLTHGAERFDQLQGRLEAAGVKTVDAAIPFLGEDILSNFTFMHTSRSIQGASPEYPRAILWSGDSKMLVSFNGHSSLDGNDRLEIIEFNDGEARFEFHTVNQTPDGLVFQNENGTQNCFGCHGMISDDLKPVWDVYQVWRGAYGANNDRMDLPGSEKAKNDYVSFLNSSKDHPRYSKLKFDFTKSTLSPFSDRFETSMDLDQQPNMRLGIVINRLAAKRIVRQIRERGEPAAIKALSTLMACPQTPLDETLQAAIEPRISTWISRTHTPVGYDQDFVNGITSLLAAPMTRLFQVARDLEIPNHEWATTQEKNSNTIFEGTRFPFDAIVAHELYEQLMQSMPELRPMYSRTGFKDIGDKSKTGHDADSLGAVLGESSLLACPLLKR